MELESPKLTEFLNKLRQLGGKTFEAILLKVGARLGLKIEEIVSQYPEAKARQRGKVYSRTNRAGETYLSAFVSAAQQGYVFWLIKSGKIPYKRTGQLGRSINSRAKKIEGGVEVQVGTNLSYAAYVIGDPEDEQALIHQNYWTPLVDNVTKHLDELTAFTEKELAGAINAYL